MEALRALEEIVGAEHLVTGERVLDVNRDTLPHIRAPLAYAYPGDREALKGIIDWAREHQVALWTSSQGRNWAYGAATPRNERSVVVLLRRLNRIVHVDPELAYAVIEPGVSYRQLHEHLQAEHPQLWIDAIDGTPNGSVLGNALERGVGPTPYGDHYAQLCGLEVLLPSGEIIHTGGLRDSRTLHTYRWGSGPVIDGLFSQSNLGIVVRAGIWLMPRPECHRTVVFEMHDGARFNEVLRILQGLFVEGVVRGAVRLINDMVSLSLFTQYPNSPGQCMSAGQIDDLRRRLGLARSTLSAGLYGHRAAVAAHQRIIKRRLSSYGRLMFLDDTRVKLIEGLLAHAQRRGRRGWYGSLLHALPGWLSGKPVEVVASIPRIHRLLKGEPTEYFVRHAYFKMPERPERDVHPARDGCGLIWLAPVVPNRPEDIEKVLELGRETYQRWGFEFHVALIFHNARAAVVLMSIFYFKDVEEERERAAGLHEEMVMQLRALRYQEYRTAISQMQHLYADDAAYRDLLGRLKSAVDPDGILSPGRYEVGASGDPGRPGPGCGPESQ